jgi:hypothetical protein
LRAGIPALYFGMLALAVAIIVVMWRVHRTIERGADEARVLITAGGIVTSWPSVLLTRMHERYTFSSLVTVRRAP